MYDQWALVGWDWFEEVSGGVFDSKYFDDLALNFTILR